MEPLRHAQGRPLRVRSHAEPEAGFGKIRVERRALWVFGRSFGGARAYGTERFRTPDGTEPTLFGIESKRFAASADWSGPGRAGFEGVWTESDGPP